MDFRLDQGEITNELYNFCTTGNGILTGHPGVGKSYEIEKLVHYLEERNHPVLFLPIDKIIAETDFDLREELDLKANLFDYIATEESASALNKGIVIIDAFDAARSGNKRNFYLQLIRKIVAKLDEEWNVLVVVRIFDAKRSSELLNIFSGKSKIEQELPLKILRTSKEIPCRHVILPELSLNDLNHILSNHPILSKYSENLNQRLKELLLNPFYISLIIYLIQTEKDSMRINSVYSEVQLLDLYWNSRVENNQLGITNGNLLRILTDTMIKTHSLSASIFEFADLPPENINYLLSSDILTPVGINGTKIAYAHNILFDYAVSKLIIDDNEIGLVNFISTDRSNAIYLQPSIRYFLTKVWYNDKKLFKKICLSLFKAKENEVPLIAKILPNRVLVQEADTINDCKFIRDLYKNDDNYRNWLHATIFSLLISLEGKSEFPYLINRKFWLDYFEHVIQNSRNPNDFNIASWLYKIQNEDKSPDIQSQIGRISRRMLSTCLELRGDNVYIDKFASHLPASLVAKTFSTDPSQSRQILERILGIAQEEDFELWYLTSVAQNIKEILPNDPEFVSKFYVFIFSRSEVSTKPTEMGNAGHFQLTSTRRQDFESIRYLLGQESETFLDSDLKTALRTIIKSINFSVCREHIFPYLQEGHSIQENIINFPFNKKESKFLEDHCYIWSDSHFRMEPEFEMLTQMENKITNLLEKPTQRSSIETVLDAYRDNAVVALFWRNLIRIATSNPEPFSSVILDLITAKPLQLHSETVNELAELIEVSIASLSDDEISRITTSIIKNFEELDDEGYKKFEQRKRNYLLSKIPARLLPPGDVKEVVADYLKNNPRPPRKPVEFGPAEVGYASEQDILEFKEIDPDIPINKILLPKISEISKFNEKWRKGKVTETDALIILQPLQELYSQVEGQKNTIPDNTIDYAWEVLARCSMKIAGGIEKPDSDLFITVRNILLKSATRDSAQYREKYSPDYDLSYSPSPVTDAAEGLLDLFSLQDDEEIWKSIEQLSRNKNPSVRSIVIMRSYHILEKDPDKFWKTIDASIENENIYKIHEWICRGLTIAFKRRPDDANKVKKRFEAIWNKQKELGSEGLGFINYSGFIEAASYFAFAEETPWAKKFLEEVIEKPEIYATIRPKVVSEVIDQFFRPPTLFNLKYDNARERLSRWLNYVIQKVIEEIRLILSATPNNADIDKEQMEHLYGVVEEYTTRFYFIINRKYNKIDDPEKSIRAIEIVFNLERNTLEYILDSLLSDTRMPLRLGDLGYFMEILDSCMSQYPEKSLELAVKVLKIGDRYGYASERFGGSAIQEFIDHLLADHQDILKDDIAMTDFTEVLNYYAKGNSPEAFNYIMSLDFEYQ